LEINTIEYLVDALIDHLFFTVFFIKEITNYEAHRVFIITLVCGKCGKQGLWSGDTPIGTA
jgi:hypothetical protein